MEPKPTGLYRNVPMGEYRLWPGISPSAAVHALISPKAYHNRPAEREETDEMRLGTVCHICVFEPDDLLRRVVLWDGARRYGKDWDAFCDANAGKVILTEQFYRRALAVRDAANADAQVREIVKQKAEIEPSLAWTHEATTAPMQLACKGRPDFVADRIYDLKTVFGLQKSDGGRDAMYWMALERGHFHQQGGYQSGWLAATGERKTSSIIYIETKPPFDCMVKDIDDVAQDIAAHQWRESLEVIARGMHTGQWPGRNPTRTPFYVPDGALSRDALDLDFE